MISYGQKTLNKNDVRKATLRFFVAFALLAALSFFSVFLFYKSSRMQAKNIQQELDHYHEMLGRQELLRIKFDTILKKMDMLSNDKVGNDIFLRNGIIEDLNVSRQLIGKDSTGDLQHYNKLALHLQPILTFKNELLKIKAEQGTAQRNLNACLESTGQINQRIAAQVQASRPQQKGRLMDKYKR